VSKKDTGLLTASQTIAQVASAASHERRATEIPVTILKSLEVDELAFQRQSTEKER
jgi:hypothetical protein